MQTERLTQKPDFLKLVDKVDGQTVPQGNALILGQFPPMTSAASYHASALLHALKTSGYHITSMAGPGLSVARRTCVFVSNQKLRKSTAFLDNERASDIAVVYAKALEFARISKPTWYKRRVEEIRRIALFARILGRSKRTVLVLEDASLLRRDAWAFGLTGVLVSFARWKRFSITQRRRPPHIVAERLTGTAQLPADVHAAEHSSYDAAIDPAVSEHGLRLTAPRAEQSARFHAETDGSENANAIFDDVFALSQAMKADDLRGLPSMRLLGSMANSARFQSSVGSSVPQAANELVNGTFGVPITRFMMHLRLCLGLEARFPLKNRAEARRFLGWYLSEAQQEVAGHWVPVPKAIRDDVWANGNGRLSGLDDAAGLAHMAARDNNPFPLPSHLVDVHRQMSANGWNFDLHDPFERLAFVCRVALSLDEEQSAAAYLGPKITRYLTSPVGGDGGSLSRFEFYLALLLRAKMYGKEEVERPWKAYSVRAWIVGEVRSRLPQLDGLLPRHQQTVPVASPALRISGLPNSSTGVGANLQMTARAMRATGCEPAISDLGAQLRQTSGVATTLKRGQRPIVIHHVNADQIPQSIVACAEPGAYHVGFLLWEFDVLPEAHMLALDMLDEIWTPSRFVRRAYARTAKQQVHNVLKGLSIPRTPSADLGQYGIRPDDTVFLTCFDFHSSVERKNPLATVEAFLAAFPPGHTRARLIVKTTPPIARHWGDPKGQWQRIEALAAQDERIVLVKDHLPFHKLIGLIKAADCLVSTHRSEGFGLIPAFALGVATPVISTDYSGTTDFCTEVTSMPVPFKMVPVETSSAIFPMEGAVWADVDVEAVAQEMRSFADDPINGRMLAIRGKRVIEGKYSPAALARRYEQRIKDIQACAA